MAVNMIVLSVTLLMLGFLAVWCCCPWLRPWLEAPKYRVLRWEQDFPSAVRAEQPAPCQQTS